MKTFISVVLFLALCSCSGNNVVKDSDTGSSTDADTTSGDLVHDTPVLHARGSYDVSLEPHAPIARDLDDDGDLDLLVAHQFSSEVSVFEGNGNGGFTAKPPIEAARAVDSAAGDFDADGLADLVLSVESEPTILVVSDLVDTAVTTELTMSASGDGVVVADVDDDGDEDIAASVAGSGSEPSTRVAVFLNEGTGVFTSPETYEVAFQPRQLLAADVGDDGDIDLAVMLGTTSALILEGDGTGAFAAGAPFGAGDGVLHAALLDADQSGALDMVFADLTADALTLAVDVPGTDAEHLTGVAAPFDVVTAALNDDAIPDLAVSSVDDASIRGLLSSDGTYRPVELASIPDAVRLGGLVTADFDGDGLDDVAVVERGRDQTPGKLHTFTSSEAPTR